MKNYRIRNSVRQIDTFAFKGELLSPSSTDRNQTKPLEFTDRAQNKPKNDNMLQNMKIKFLLNDLIKRLKYLTPPSSVPENIIEEWETTTQQEQDQPQRTKEYAKQTLGEELNHRFQCFRHLNSIEGLLIVLFCWTVTVSIVFRINIGFQLYVISLIVSLARMIFLSTFAIKQQNNQNADFLVDFFQDLATPALLCISCGLFALRCKFDLGPGTYIIQLIGVLTVIFQYKQLQINFRYIVKYAEQNKMKKQLRIIELFLLIITLAHFFGLCFYGATYFQPPQSTNWLQKSQLSAKPWHIQYIYCLYWAITTIVTVGYGDLTPQNYVQVIIVMIVQLIGTAVFGYMINVIGITVDEIKKKTEQFDNYQQTIDKLKDHYQLSRTLCHKMKYDIKQKQNEFKNIPLKTSEEKDFLDYIQPNLKQQFVLQTNMRVIKKSIFFLTHFTVNFQNQIALRLIRIIYKPEQEIPIFDMKQQQCQRLMVIINSGCVHINIEQHHNNVSIMKKLREIKPADDGLFMNVFGYSSLIMNRNIRLKAITKQTAVSYILRRKDVLQCIQKSILDFESFNEMREKMVLYKCLEEVEAPSIRQDEWHYIPNIFILQKKITYENQSRLAYYRKQSRGKLKLITSKSYQNKTIPKIEDEHHQMGDNILGDDEFHSLSSLETKTIEEQNYLQPNQNDSFLGKLVIDQCKVFQNFMKSFNLPVIAAAYQKSCQRKSYRKRMRTTIIQKPGSYMIENIQQEYRANALKRQKTKTFF